MSDENPDPANQPQPLRVELVSNPPRPWDRLVNVVKDVSVLFTALFAIGNFLLPQSWRDDVAIWWAALDQPRADAVVEPMFLEQQFIEGASDSGPMGWVYAGNGEGSETAPPWVFGVNGSDIEPGDILDPTTDVNVRSERVTGLNTSPLILDVLRVGGGRCVRVETVDPSERTPSVWIFGEIVEC
ncbi:MAG: hypothetical protein AAF376_01160 [Pseudomonadota bacterium]